MIQHIIFDCDGVLIDSEAISMRIDHELLAENDVFLTEAELHQRFVGTTFEGMVLEIESQYGISLPGNLSQLKDVRMLAQYRTQLRAITGVEQVLKDLQLPCSIGTNGPRSRALEALKITGLDKYFGTKLTTFEDVANGKPAPDVYLLAAKRAGLSPEQCIVVEDSTTGVKAGVAAGCIVLGFTGSHQLREDHGVELLRLGARQIFSDMTQLLDIIRLFE